MVPLGGLNLPDIKKTPNGWPPTKQIRVLEIHVIHPIPLHLNGHSSLDVIGAKDDGGGGENWSYKMCKAAVQLSPPTNRHPAFNRLDALLVAQPTVSKR